MEKNFNEFISHLAETNAALDFYSDFEKIKRNVDNISISLNMLNFLLGKEDLGAAVHALWIRDPKVFNVLDILIATRRKEKRKFIDTDGSIRLVASLFTSEEGVIRFLEETGLADLFKNSTIHDLVDYVFGVETGLDTHARKNRSGDITELLMHRILKANGIPHRMEVVSSDIPEIHDALGRDEKRFDFMIKTRKQTFLVEVNFYNSGGSKPNEIARAYRELAQIVNRVDGYEFVWITDGEGWLKAKNKLEEAYIEIPRVYNFTSLNEFLEEIKSEL